MSSFKEQFDMFQLTSAKCKYLQHLAESNPYLLQSGVRVLVETVVVDEGERRVIKKEEQGAKLV
jgi:hypothetical protein